MGCQMKELMRHFRAYSAFGGECFAGERCAGKVLPAARFTQAKPALIDASLSQMLVLSPRPHLQSG